MKYTIGWKLMLQGVFFLMMLPLPLLAQGQVNSQLDTCLDYARSLLDTEVDTAALRIIYHQVDSLIEAHVAAQEYDCAYAFSLAFARKLSVESGIRRGGVELIRTRELAMQCEAENAMAQAMGGLAKMYASIGEADSATFYANRFYEEFEGAKEFFSVGYLGLTMGNVYYALSDFDTADRWFRSALEKIEASEGDRPAFYPYLLRNLALLAEERGDSEYAVQLLEDVMELFDEADSSHIKMITFGELIRNRILIGDASTAVADFQHIWGVAQAQGYYDVKPIMAVNIAWAHETVGDTSKAITWYQKGLSFDMFPEDRLYILQHLSELQAAQSSYAGAYQSLWEASLLWDTLEVQVPQERMNAMVARLDSTVHRLEEAQAREENAELREERGYLLFTLAIAFLISVVLVLLALLYRRRQLDQQEALEKQREESRQKALALMQRIEVESLDAMLEGQDQERSRIAADLHDSLGGTLAAVKISLVMLKPQTDTASHPAYDRSLELLEKGIEDVRRISHDLGDNVLLQQGLHRALVKMSDSLRQQNHFELDLQLAGFRRQRFSNVLEVNLYRIVQELMQNIIKHAGASTVSLQMSRVQSRLSLIVQDDGQGMNPEQVQRKGAGMGMRNLKARVEKLKGTLEIDSKPGEGTTVIVQVPIPEPNRITT